MATQLYPPIELLPPCEYRIGMGSNIGRCMCKRINENTLATVGLTTVHCAKCCLPDGETQDQFVARESLTILGQQMNKVVLGYYGDDGEFYEEVAFLVDRWLALGGDLGKMLDTIEIFGDHKRVTAEQKAELIEKVRVAQPEINNE